MLALLIGILGSPARATPPDPATIRVHVYWEDDSAWADTFVALTAETLQRRWWRRRRQADPPPPPELPVDPPGKPVSYAAITVTGPLDPPVRYTGPDGTETYVLPPGTYRISATHDDAAGAFEEVVEAIAGGEHEVRIDLGERLFADHIITRAVPPSSSP